MSAFTLTIVTLIVSGFLYVGQLLVVESTPRPADVGVVLAGDFARPLYAADLYQQGLISRIWITRPVRERGLAQVDALGIPYPRQEEVSRAVLLKKGVPDERIEFVGEELVSTAAEAKAVAHHLEAFPMYRHVLVITSRPHVRRAQAVFRHALRRLSSVSVLVLGSPYDGFVAAGWWRDRDSARQVVLETAKLAALWLGMEF